MKTAAEFFISSPKRRIFALLLVAADLIIIFAIMRICPSTHRVRRTNWNKSSSSISFATSSFASCRPLHAKCMPYLIPTPTYAHNKQPVGHGRWERKKRRKRNIYSRFHSQTDEQKQKGKKHNLFPRNKSLSKRSVSRYDINIDHAINPFQLIIARVTCNWSEQNYGLISPVLQFIISLQKLTTPQNYAWVGVLLETVSSVTKRSA